MHEAAVAAQAILDGGTTLFAAGVDTVVVARTQPDDHQAVPVRVQRRRVGAHRRRQVGRVAGDGGAGRRGVPRREDRGGAAELDDESAAELLESIGQTERGLDALARAGFHTLKLQTYLTAGPKGVTGLDDPPGRHRAEGRRRHPHRLREGLHQGRDRLVRRPGRSRLDGRGQGRGQGSHGGQGLRDGRRRRGRVPVQRLGVKALSSPL